jgi:DNA replication and repair protein RecF
LIFRLDDFEVRRYASQGQHRTFGMALKLAQYFYLYDRLEEAPLFLLDDVFDTLDERRTKAFLDLMQTDAIGQSIITAAQRYPFDTLVPFESAENQTLLVTPGAVQVDVPAQM